MTEVEAFIQGYIVYRWTLAEEPRNWSFIAGLAHGAYLCLLSQPGADDLDLLASIAGGRAWGMLP